MAKRSLPPIQSERVRLRLLEEGDLPLTLNWRNRDDIRIWFVNSDVIAPENHLKWFAQYQDRDDDFVFIIDARLDTWKPIGQVSLYSIDWDKRHAKFGRLMIGESPARGKGMAKEAVRLIVDYGFDQLGLVRIELEVFDTNGAAISIYKDCGFEEESSAQGLVQMSKTRP